MSARASIDIVNYRPSWQVMRVSTLSENNPYGGMVTPEGSQDGIQRMLNYIEDANPQKQLPSGGYVAAEIERMQVTLEQEYAARIYRVFRFLTSTVNGMISDQTKHHIDDIQLIKGQLEPRLNMKLVNQYADQWNWEVIRFELEELWRQERHWFMAIDADMRQRVVEKNKSAEEMMTFISLMKEVNSLGNAG